jgi:hypothetical protein
MEGKEKNFSLYIGKIDELKILNNMAKSNEGESHREGDGVCLDFLSKMWRFFNFLLMFFPMHRLFYFKMWNSRW